MRLGSFSALVTAALISSAPSISLGQEYRPDATTAPSTSEGYNSEKGSSNPGGNVDTNTNIDKSSPGGTTDTQSTTPGNVTEPTNPGDTQPDSSSPSYTTPDSTSPSYPEPEKSPGGKVRDKENERGMA